ncbi:MAG: hypothetical protein ACREBC_39275, partial [Pyrinomonadaceae bacterium]
MKRTADNGQLRKAQPLSNHLHRVLRSAQQLVIYRDILEDPIVSELLQLLETLSRGPKSKGKSFQKMSKSYAQFFSRLAAKTRSGKEPLFGSVLQDHLLDLILGGENAFSSKAQVTG